MRKLLAIAVFTMLLTGMVSAVDTSLEEIQQVIRDRGYNWTAGNTNISIISEAEYQGMLSIQIPEGWVFEAPEVDPGHRSFGRGSMDWRDMGGVSPVKSQGNCGSCWAFCTVHMLESMVMIYDGYTADLSEQQLVSCNTQGYGCNGGWLDCVEYFISPGMAEESCMPYQASNIPCAAGSCEKIAIADDWAYTGDSVSEIKAALEDGPVSTAIYASDAMSYYTSGCFEWGTTSNVNHGVLIVGYDDAECNNQGAWIIKNSWGTGWGENGFMKIKYGDSAVGYGATRVYYTPNSNAKLAISDYSIQDSLIGNGDGFIDPGETLDISVSLGNSGNIPATGVGAVLTCSSPEISLIQNLATWPDIPAGQQIPGTSNFKIQVPSDFPVGERIEFSLAITCNEASTTDGFMAFSGRVNLVYWSSFEGSTDENWTHQEINTQDDWQRARPQGTSQWDPQSAPHGNNIWGNDLGPNGWNGEYKANTQNILISPSFVTSSPEDLHLTFNRWLSVEKRESDQARIFINDTLIWVNPLGMDLVDTEWMKIDMDISAFISADVPFQVKFELQSNGTGELGGWNIDDLTVYSILPDAAPTPTPTRPPGAPDIDLEFIHEKSAYEPGDVFDMGLEIENFGVSVNGVLFIALQYGDAFWFYPNWQETVSFEMISLTAGQKLELPVIAFDIPTTMPACGPFNMYGIVTEASAYEMLSELAVTEFSFM